MGYSYRSRQENRKTMLMIGLGFGVPAFLLIMYLFVSQLPMSSKQLARKYGDEVYLCQDVIGLQPMPLSEKKPVDEIRRIVFVEADLDTNALTLHDWQQQLPPEWAANGEDEVDAIVCLRFAYMTVGECSYSVGLGTDVVQRQRQRLEITIIDAESEKSIRYDQINGADPGPCPDTMPSIGGSVPNIQGPDISYEEVVSEIMRYIVPVD